MLHRTYSSPEGGIVTLSLSLPVAVSDRPSSEWQVTITSRGLAEDYEQPIYGVDGIQAMELAIRILHTIEEVDGLEIADDADESSAVRGKPTS